MANISTIKVGNTSYGITATPTAHASTATTYGAASASNYGHVKLSDNYTSSAGTAASGIGASSAAVYNAYNTLNSNLNKKYLYHEELPLSAFSTRVDGYDNVYLSIYGSADYAGNYIHFKLNPEELIPNDDYGLYVRHCTIYLRNTEYVNSFSISAYSSIIVIRKSYDSNNNCTIEFMSQYDSGSTASNLTCVVKRSGGNTSAIPVLTSVNVAYQGNYKVLAFHAYTDKNKSSFTNVDINKYVVGLIIE